MFLDRTAYQKRAYKNIPMQLQFVDTAILQTLLDKFVELGLIDELVRFQIYSNAAESIQRLPGDNIEIMAELIMLADSHIDDDGKLKANGKVIHADRITTKEIPEPHQED